MLLLRGKGSNNNIIPGFVDFHAECKNKPTNYEKQETLKVEILNLHSHLTCRYSQDRCCDKSVCEECEIKLVFFFFKIFDSELEYLTEYNGFNDWLNAFPLYRGKKTSEDDDDDHRIVGKFKVLTRFCYAQHFIISKHMGHITSSWGLIFEFPLKL